MLNDLERVLMFRCVQDPMIGPKPRNAFMLTEKENPGWEAWFNNQTGSVYVKVPTPSGIRRHIIPTGNLASIELCKEEENGKIQNATGERPEESPKTNKGGRPRLHTEAQ